MWVRDNENTINNSASLKFEISFYPEEEDLSAYQKISILLFKNEKRFDFKMKIELCNTEDCGKFVKALKSRRDFQAYTEQTHPSIMFNLKTGDPSEIASVLHTINEIRPSELSEDALNEAMIDLKTKVIPAVELLWERETPILDRTRGLFDGSLDEEEMASGPVAPPPVARSGCACRR